MNIKKQVCIRHNMDIDVRIRRGFQSSSIAGLVTIMILILLTAIARTLIT